MNTSGDAADQVMRMMLNGTEVLIKLSGAGAKQTAVLLYSILKQQHKTKGAERLSNMLRSGKPLKVYTFKDNDLEKFKECAKQYGVLYTVLKDKDKNDGVFDVMVRADDASKISRIVERFNLTHVDTASIRAEVVKEKENKEKEKAGKNESAEPSAEKPEGEDKDEPEKSKPDKVDPDKVVDDLFAKPAESKAEEGKVIQNPTTARTENSTVQNSSLAESKQSGGLLKESSPSEPFSQDGNGTNLIDRPEGRRSVRAELERIRREQVQRAKAEHERNERIKEPGHKNKSKNKSRKGETR